MEVRLPGHLDVKWLECLRGFHQEQWRLGSGVGRKLDLPPEPLDPAALHIVGRDGLSLGQQSASGFECAGMQMSVGRGESALRAPLRLSGQFDRTLQKRSRCRQPGASLGRDRRLFELRRDRFVRSRRSSSQMPDATLRIDLGIGRGWRAPSAQRDRSSAVAAA